MTNRCYAVKGAYQFLVNDYSVGDFRFWEIDIHLRHQFLVWRLLYNWLPTDDNIACRKIWSCVFVLRHVDLMKHLNISSLIYHFFLNIWTLWVGLALVIIFCCYILPHAQQFFGLYLNGKALHDSFFSLFGLLVYGLLGNL